jgi:hypothetical protein
VGAEAGSFETALKNFFLARVTETSQVRVRPVRAEPSEEAPDRVRTPDRHDRDALAVEIATAARRKGLERDLVADSFDEHDGT